MAGYRRSPVAAILCLACALQFVTGCEVASEPEARATTAASSSGGAQPSAPAPTRAPRPTSLSSETKCLRAERAAAYEIWLGRAVMEVTGAPGGHSAEARSTVMRFTSQVERRLVKRCGGEAPAAFKDFMKDVRSTVAADRFGDRQLDAILAAWLRWGTAVGVPQAAHREIRHLEACRRRVLPRFDAFYRVLWAWTNTGKVWWVELTLENRTGRLLDGSMTGRAAAIRMLEDPFGPGDPDPGQGRDELLMWGGSSADYLEVRPGKQVLRVAPDADQDVHTTTEGKFQVTDFAVELTPRGKSYGCAPPVRRLP